MVSRGYPIVSFLGHPRRQERWRRRRAAARLRSLLEAHVGEEAQGWVG